MKQEHQIKVPKLRFREFQVEWNCITGGLLFDSISDKDHNSDLPILAITQDQGAIPRELIEFNISVTDKSIEGYKVVRKGDFIISLRSFQGGIEYSEYDGICSPAYIILRPNTKIVDYFFKNLFKTDRYITEMNRKLEGIRDGKMVSYKYFSEIVINHPSLPEQQKIASFFSLIDEKIEKLKTKKSLLEKYKKGVMQKIFSREIRFENENGGEFGEWEEKKLGEIGDIITGKTPSTSDDNLWGGDIQFITPTDINGNKYQSNTQRTVTQGIKMKVLPEKSIMFTCIASIGKMSLSLHPCITNQQINSIVPYKNINNEFLYYAIMQISDFIKSTQSSNTLPIINKTEFSKFKLQIPTFPEQQKIASFLSEIDKKIDSVNIEIESLEKWKKGLLQGMFI